MSTRLAILSLMLLAVPLTARAEPEVLLAVNDGSFFYDADDDCVGDSDDPAAGVATRHWHVGIPLAPAVVEAAGGFGCLGGPKTWTVTIEDGMVGTVDGSVRYTWDQNVPGGCCNDVHIHVLDASGLRVASTLQTEGPEPVIPTVEPVRSHDVAFMLEPGEYTIVEDIFSGEHTAWLTTLTVTQDVGYIDPY